MREDDEGNDDGESTGKGRRYLWVALLSLLVFLALFWYFRIWKAQETEVAVLPAGDLVPMATPVESEAVDALPIPGQETPASDAVGTLPATISTPDVPPLPTPAPSPPDRPSFPKALKEETSVPLTPRKSAPPKKPKKPAVQRSAARGKYTIQVGSFAEESPAAALTKRLKGKGYDAYVIKSDVPGVGVRWRVRVGHFENRVEAQSVAQRLQKKEGLAFFLATDGA